MNTDDVFDNSLSDELLNDSLSEIDDAGLPDRRDLRQQRLDEYVAAGLSSPDCREAVLTLASTDLLSIGFSFAQVVKDYLAAAPATTDSVRQITPVLNDYLRVTRQHERYAQLQLRFETARIQAQEAKCRSQSAAMLAHVQQVPCRPR